jgi:hypothetical protein
MVKIVGDIKNLYARRPDYPDYSIVALVEQMLELHKQRAASRISNWRDAQGVV